MLKPGESSPHVRRRLDFFFGIPRSFRPGCLVGRGVGSRSPAGGRSLCRIVSGWRIRRTRARMPPFRIMSRRCSGRRPGGGRSRFGGWGCGLQHHTLRRFSSSGLPFSGYRFPLGSVPSDRRAGPIRSARPVGGPADRELTPSGSIGPCTFPPGLGRAGPLHCPSGTPRSGSLTWPHSRWRIAHNFHLTYRFIQGPGRRSGWTLI